MASNSTKAKTSRWGSLLSGAVAGLESRLDNIFAEEEERALQDRAAAAAAAAAAKPSQEPKAAVPPASSKRLQERLAKAVATQKTSSQPPSEVPSRSATPLLEIPSPRPSTSSRPEVDVPSSSPEVQNVQPTEDAVETLPEPSTPSTSTLLTSSLPINPARKPKDTPAPSSLPVEDAVPSSEPTRATDSLIDTPKASSVAPASLDLATASTPANHVQANTEHEEEVHAHLERIDALQAKLQYLARETVAAAREANATSQPASLEQKLAEKDERIALLMEEGSKLSKAEMRHLATIKKLRAKTADDDRATLDLQNKVSKLEQSNADLKQRLKQADQVEKLANERLKRLQKVERDLDNTKTDVEGSRATVAILRKQLADAEERAQLAERTAQEKSVQVDSKKVSELQQQLSDLRTEKNLAEDRSAGEVKRITEEAERDKERLKAREAELMVEVSNMESRIEALRSRAEEATSQFTGDSQAKLLRQVETLQTQYSLAAENWRTIETSLNSRIAAIGKERDDLTKREADMRKKAKDASSRCRRAEDEQERVAEELQNLSQQVATRTSEIKALQTRLAAAEKTLEESRADSERQRRILESEFSQKLDEEKTRGLQQQQQQQGGLGINTDIGGTTSSRTQSPTSFFRSKPVAQEPSNSLHSRRNLQRVSSHEQNTFSTSRRPSALGMPIVGSSRGSIVPDTPSPGVSRQGSVFSLSQLNGLVNMPPTPSIQMTDVDADYGFDAQSSPQQTINDVISASTVHTGPSVQLVERMSSSIRRLESEKAAHKDELARLTSQRDESRNEVLALMREVESKRQTDDKTSKLEREFGEVKQRYEACLEILGEREEEVEELKGDVVELKRIYRDLAERSM